MSNWTTHAQGVLARALSADKQFVSHLHPAVGICVAHVLNSDDVYNAKHKQAALAQSQLEMVK